MKLVKKIITILLTITLTAGITACGISSTSKCQTHKRYYLDAFDTMYSIMSYDEEDTKVSEMAEILHETMVMYNDLYDIYTPIEGLNNLNYVNSKAGTTKEAIVVDQKIIDLLNFGVRIYEISNGKTNIAMGSVLSLWHRARSDANDVSSPVYLPSMESLEEAAKHMNIEDLVIDDSTNTVYFTDKKLQLDVGAIAKGYATEKAAQTIKEAGYTNFILNIGGNLRAIGGKTDDDPWICGIQDPDLSDGDKSIVIVKIKDTSLATSGVYQRYFTYEGKQYHHIIDPDTLYPEDRYLSVSVITPDAGFADSMSTTLFNMDLEESMKLAESIDDLEAMWILPDRTIKYSSGFNKYIYEQ